MKIESLGEARRVFFRAARKHGMRCPCCRRWGKINPFTINYKRAADLIWLGRAQATMPDPDAWINVPDKAPLSVMRGIQLGHAKHWKLVEHMDKKPDRTKCSGYWRLNDRGRAFIADQLKVPYAVWIFDDQFCGASGPDIGVREALDDHFDYLTLMQASYDDRAAFEPKYRGRKAAVFTDDDPDYETAEDMSMEDFE